MRKVYLLEIIFAIWLVILFSILFSVVAKADNGAEMQTEEQPMIAFTFDDGPNFVQTARLLDGLAERGAKATFFVLGEKLDFHSNKPHIEENRALLKRIAEEGHEIGNHTYSHCWLNRVSQAQAETEFAKTNELIREITGKMPIYMRPPGGSGCITPAVRKIAAPMITVCWGYYDTRDWQCRNVDKMVQMIVDNTFDGDIVLLHDNYETSVDTALRAMDILAERGYRFVTVEELLRRNLGTEWALDPDRIYCTMKPGDTSRLRRIEENG